MDKNKPLLQYPMEKAGAYSIGEVTAHELKLGLNRSVTGSTKSNGLMRAE